VRILTSQGCRPIALAPALRGEGEVRGLSLTIDPGCVFVRVETAPHPDPLPGVPGRGRSVVRMSEIYYTSISYTFKWISVFE